MNVLLRDTEEFIDGKPTGSLGLVLIRYATAPVDTSELVSHWDRDRDHLCLDWIGIANSSFHLDATTSSGWAPRIVSR